MFNTEMSPMEKARTEMQVNNVNKKMGVRKAGEKNHLGKDSFLKLLVTELRHQDPTKPMEDKQFIAQMAQFSSLEQMSNINKELGSLIKSAHSNEAYSMLGKTVDAFNPVSKKRVSGLVESISYDQGQVMLKVGNEHISIKNVHAVHHTEAKTAPVTERKSQDLKQ